MISRYFFICRNKYQESYRNNGYYDKEILDKTSVHLGNIFIIIGLFHRTVDMLHLIRASRARFRSLGYRQTGTNCPCS